ncbi:MAG: PepSY domain-containing protein, partial [Methylocystis sp.]
MAGFLIVVGLTGSLLAFYAELNHWLAPDVWPARVTGRPLDMAALSRRAESLVHDGQVNTVYVGYGVTAIIGMDAKPGVSALDFTRLHLDPVTGQETARLHQGKIPTSLPEIMP